MSIFKDMGIVKKNPLLEFLKTYLPLTELVGGGADGTILLKKLTTERIQNELATAAKKVMEAPAEPGSNINCLQYLIEASKETESELLELKTSIVDPVNTYLTDVKKLQHTLKSPQLQKKQIPTLDQAKSAIKEIEEIKLKKKETLEKDNENFLKLLDLLTVLSSQTLDEQSSKYAKFEKILTSIKQRFDKIQRNKGHVAMREEMLKTLDDNLSQIDQLLNYFKKTQELITNLDNFILGLKDHIELSSKLVKKENAILDLDSEIDVHLTIGTHEVAQEMNSELNRQLNEYQKIKNDISSADRKIIKWFKNIKISSYQNQPESHIKLLKNFKKLKSRFREKLTNVKNMRLKQFKKFETTYTTKFEQNSARIVKQIHVEKQLGNNLKYLTEIQNELLQNCTS